MKKICKACKKEFECYDEGRKGDGIRYKLKRRHNAVTCSKKCSKIWNRRIR